MNATIWTSTLWTSSQITTLPVFQGDSLDFNKETEKKALGMASIFFASNKYHKLNGISIYYRTAIHIAVAPVDLDCYQYELQAQDMTASSKIQILYLRKDRRTNQLYGLYLLLIAVLCPSHATLKQGFQHPTLQALQLQ